MIYLFSAAIKRKSIAGANRNTDEVVDKSPCCASCGITEIDNIKLMDCDGCDLVRYCSDACRGNHRLEHGEACKERTAELRDELLFMKPESSHLGDCPICCVPMPLDRKKSFVYTCCSKTICNGCNYANQNREIGMRLQSTCPFCRELLPKDKETDEEHDKRMMKRIEANDPAAMTDQGNLQYLNGEYIRAFEYFTKAAELGDAQAHHRLAEMYHDGKGVGKDEEMEIHHLEEAAIGGHPIARYNLGYEEWRQGNFERAVKHLVIAATLGFDESLEELTKAFKCGLMEKEDLAAALRAHQAAVDATKSPQREKAGALLSK